MRFFLLLFLISPALGVSDRRVRQQPEGYNYNTPQTGNPFTASPNRPIIPAVVGGSNAPSSVSAGSIASTISGSTQAGYSRPQVPPQPLNPVRRPAIQPELPQDIGGERQPLVPQTIQPQSENNEIQQEEHHEHVHPSSQIEGIEVACDKEKMNVRISFGGDFDGMVYSKGHFHNPACRYVTPGGARKIYEFEISVDGCGSQYVDQQLKEGGEAYLENIIVFMNEPGIQEVWDTARRIRCLWQGNFEQSVNYQLGVDMLDLQTVTFSGDSVTAVMDVQVGQGPHAQSVTGLVKIGDIMTMVVKVDGPPDFDILVRDCIAHDGDSKQNSVNLVDSRGCILKPKLVGAFQKTRQTASADASILSFAFFQAFKFPDQTEVYLECNVELCKGSCSVCPETDQPILPIDPRSAIRRRRAIVTANNSTAEPTSDPVRVGRKLRIVSPDDLAGLEGFASIAFADGWKPNEDVCMSMPSFFTGLVVMLLILIASCILTATLCYRTRHSQNQLKHDPCVFPMGAQGVPAAFVYATGTSKA